MKTPTAETLRRFELPRGFHYGKQLRSALAIAASESPGRQILVVDGHGTVGVLIDPDEYNLLMQQAEVIKRLADELSRRGGQDALRRDIDMSPDNTMTLRQVLAELV
ncbi:MAG TPA: hypothetical protein VG651_14545 [Stellaceae bacterium]|nr:hypothetical protein [Stellaceae bacterium]